MRQNSIDQGTTSDSLESNTTEKNSELASSSTSSVTSSCSSSSLLPSYRLLPPPSFPTSSSSSSISSQRRRKCIVTTVWYPLYPRIYIFTFHFAKDNIFLWHVSSHHLVDNVVFATLLFFRDRAAPPWREFVLHSQKRKLFLSDDIHFGFARFLVNDMMWIYLFHVVGGTGW